MPRIQILHLPAPPDEYPFVVILDDIGPLANIAVDPDGIAAKVGAVACLCFAGPVEVV